MGKQKFMHGGRVKIRHEQRPPRPGPVYKLCWLLPFPVHSRELFASKHSNSKVEPRNYTFPLGRVLCFRNIAEIKTLSTLSWLTNSSTRVFVFLNIESGLRVGLTFSACSRSKRNGQLAKISSNLKVHLTPNFFFAKTNLGLIWSTWTKKFLNLVESSIFYALSKSRLKCFTTAF